MLIDDKLIAIGRRNIGSNINIYRFAIKFWTFSGIDAIDVFKELERFGKRVETSVKLIPGYDTPSGGYTVYLEL